MMKRSVNRIIFSALVALMLVAVTATAAVVTGTSTFFGDNGGSKKVKIVVLLRSGKGKMSKAVKSHTVQYYSVRSYKKAQDEAARIEFANTKVFSGDVGALDRELRVLGVSFKQSKGNGVIEANLMVGSGVVIYDEEFGAKALEIKEGQDTYEITLESSDQMLEEVVKTGQYTSTGPVLKPVPGIDMGDQVSFTIKIELPAGYATDQSRIICQPIAVDCQTEDTMAYLQPVVLEAVDYHSKQDKRMGFDYMKNDSLARGYDASHILKAGQPLNYTTNVMYKKPDKDRVYRGSYHVVLEDYRHKIWDSGERTTGSCLAFKPLKFLDLSVAAADMPLTSEFQEDAEENMVTIPKDLHLRFETGKDVLINDSANIAEQQSIIKELKSYGDQLWDVMVQGGASPEGSIELNTKLANQRANVARNLLKRYLPSDLRISVSEPRVFTWEDVLAELGKKGDAEKYNAVKEAIEGRNPREVFALLKAMPFYESDIVPILENERIMVMKYRYEIKHIMGADEAVETYFANKGDYMTGKKRLSNGDYFNLLATITDSLELDTVTMLAYKHITSQSDYMRLKLAPYVANRMALIASRNGMPDVNILRPFIDLSRPVNLLDQSDRLNPVKINREQMVLNQAVMYFQEAKLDSAMLFIEMLENKKVQMAAASRMRKLVVFQQGYPAYLQGLLTNDKQIADIKDAERYVLNSGEFNRAIIWTELHSQLNKSREECEALLDRIPDDNPKKWYLKGIIWADEAGKEPEVSDYESTSSNGFHELTTAEEMELQRTDPEKLEEYYRQLAEYEKKLGDAASDDAIDTSKVPYFLAYFQHSFDMEKKFIRFYRNEGNVSDDIRKQYKYLRKDIPAYRKKFQLIKAAHDREIAEEAGKSVGGEETNGEDTPSNDNSGENASSEGNASSADNQ